MPQVLQSRKTKAGAQTSENLVYSIVELAITLKQIVLKGHKNECSSESLADHPSLIRTASEERNADLYCAHMPALKQISPRNAEQKVSRSSFGGPKCEKRRFGLLTP